ncbi:MAG: heterodisulfide reductase-related iron-sulfur binding cluster, partial [Moorellales bacterium]
MVAHRELYWNIPEHLLIYAVFAVVAVVVLYGMYRHYQLWRLGGPEKRWDRIGARLWGVIWEGFGHWRQLRDPYPGVMHFLIFWGIIALFALGAFLDFIQILTGYHFLVGVPYLGVSFILDVLGLLALVGVVMALIRRYVVRPERLDNKPEDAIILLLLVGILVTGYLVEGLRMAATGDFWSAAQPGGALVVRWVAAWPEATQQAAHRALWWIHGVLALVAVLYFPYSKLFHVLCGAVNQFCRNLGPKGALVPLDLENEEIEVFGIEKIEDFSWKQLFDTDACTRCGRCQDNCPAHLSQKPLSPKRLVQDLRTHLWERGPVLLAKKAREAKSGGEEVSLSEKEQEILNKALIGEVIPEDVIWSCTTCRACMEQCPVFVEHIDKVIGMRRNLVLSESRFPSEAQVAFRNMENNGNPWGIGWTSRADWAAELDVPIMGEIEEEVEVLFWPGCSGAFDDRNRKVATAMVRLLKEAGVKFAILGTEEKCCGDSARRLGNEYLFQMLAQENIETLKNYRFAEIVTTCPHCFNTLKHEYPQFGGNFQVVHHTTYLWRLIQQGRLRPKAGLNLLATYHDSCYLGRYNDIYSEPRKILESIGGLRLTEMER